MSGEGMVAVVRGLQEQGLAVTLLQGNRQYTLLPNSVAPSAPTQRPQIAKANAATQQSAEKRDVDMCTESAQHPHVDRDVQAVDGRYTSTYKTMHCNVRPTSPPVQLTEFPPQRPDLCPGHGNFIVGGAGSGATGSQIKPSSTAPTFRGGLSWPDRGSVCSPRPSHEVDPFVNSLRKYPCLSPDRSSEVMERLINYTTAKGLTRFPRNMSSPTRLSESPPHNPLESKSTNPRATRSYEPDVSIRAKKNDDPPTRDRKRDEFYDTRPVRAYDVRCVREMSKKIRDNVKAYTSYPYTQPVCPATIVDNGDSHAFTCGYQNSSNSVNTEVQAAVTMFSKEVATAPREHFIVKSVAVPASPISAGEDNVEGETKYVENLNKRTSFKSIQTNPYPSDTTLRPRKSAQTVLSTIDFHSTRNRTVVSRKTKSQEQIKLTKEELKTSLLELINEMSDSVSKNTIRDDLIKKLFATADNQEKDQSGEFKHDKSNNYVPNVYPPVCDYVGDYQELVGKLKHCYGDSKHIAHSEISPFRISDYKHLDFVLKDWIHNLHLKNSDRYMDRNAILNYVEDEIKELLKNWTAQDFDLKSEIVNILEEIPIEINKSYNATSYLNKLVDVLLKRMRNVILSPQAGRFRKKPFVTRSRKILTKKDIKDFIRVHLMDFFNEYDPMMCDELFGDLENEMVELTLDSIDCIRCGHIIDFMDEMESILHDIGQMTDSEANYLSHLILQDLQEMLNNCHFNQTYMILNVTNGSGQYTNTTNNSDFSIGSIQEEDLDANLDRYTSQLCVQINQWLDTLNIPRIKDSGFREVVVNDLAGDIVDRHKFVDLNHTDRDSAQDQLEALKYQIFKWINKLVGDENQETIEHADKLLQMINSVPVPMLVNPIHRKGRTAPCCKTETCSNNPQNSSKSHPRSERENQNQSGFLPPSDRSGNLSYGQGRQSQGMGRARPPCCKMDVCPNSGNISKLKQVSPGRMEGNVSGSSSGPASPNNPWGSNTYSSVFDPPLVNNLSQIGPMDQNQQSVYCPNRSVNDGTTHSHSGCCAPAAPSVKKLNEHYDEYLKQWVKELPIVANAPAEQKAAESARLNIYNEIWKCVTKMKLDPNIMSNNQYYSQNYFEEEIERLLQALPKSKKLDGAKPALKEQLLQKTFKMINLIKSTNAPASFKQQVIDNIDNNLLERTPTGDEEDKQYEELEKQDLADSYILYTRYKDEDHVKATVHKKKFLKKLDDFLEITKTKHNLVDVNKTSYANEIINSIDKIPIPNDQAIKEEADDILLASEVENWLTDIPQNPNTTGPLEKRAMRDTIVKKIHEVAECVCVYDNAFKAPLKAELIKYIEKMPGIQEGTNVEYMIDELANRIKNLLTSSRHVSFQSPGNYEEFSEFRPAASSFQELSEGSSYLVVGGNIVKDSGPRRPAWANVPPPVPEEEIQWLSLAETQMPSQIRSGAEVPGQSPQAYLPADQIQQRANSYRGEENVRYGEVGRIQSMRSQRYGSQQTSRNFQGEENDPRNTGPSVPEEDIQWLSLQETQMPSIVRDSTERSRSMQSPQLQRYIPNESDCRTSRSYYEDAQEVPGQFPGVPQTHLSPCCREAFYPNAQDQYTSFGQGQVDLNAQEASNLQGGKLCNPPCCPNPVCLNKSQAFRDSAPSRPAANSPGLRPNVAFQSQNLGHGAPDPYDARQPYSGQHCTTCPNIGQGPALNTCGQSYGAHARCGRGSLGQMPSQVGQEPWSNIPGYGQTGRSSVYGVIEGSGQGCMATEPNPNGTLNRPFQSPGLVSTGCQVPDQVSIPCNSQNMACGGMGILGTSQIPGPCSRTPSVRVPNQSNTDPGALQEERREAIQSSFCTPAGRGIPMINPNIRKQRPMAAGTDQKPQVYCVPPDYKPLGFSAPCRPFNQREGKHAEENHTIPFNLGTDWNEQPAKKLNNNCYVNKRLSDINEIELFNIELLQSACSTVDMITSKSKCNALKSKSQEELTQKMKRQKENKKAHRASGGLQHQVTEWLEIHNDKVQAKLLSDKMKKLAEKLKKPGGEEKLRTRIEKYLTPEQSLDGEDNEEFKKQLSNEIIRKLKKIYLTPQDNNVNVYRMESSKYCCKSKIDNFTKAVLNWTKNLKIKTKDFLGRNVKKDDVFKYVCDKLEPIILDRPQSDTEYKESLKSNITEIINDLPLETNKEFYLNEITEKLVNDIFDSESKLCSTYIQPTTKEIKQFINDELKFFFEKCHVAISAKRKEHLEIELLDLVLDFEDITEIDSYLVDYVTILFKKIGKVPEYKAKYFTNLLLKDYKEFFFRDKFFHLKSEIFNGRPEFSFKSQAANDLVDSSFETYRQQLEEEINKWISKLNVPTYDKDLEVLSKDLANDIMDRYKYFLSHPSNKGSGTEELEHLKSMIFKWTNQLVGEENTSVLAIQDLMNEINKIPKPSLQNNSVAYTPPHNIDTTNNSNKSYVDQLIEQVYNWCSDLNSDLHISQDSTQNKLLIKEFAEEIEKGVQKNEDGVIDKVVDVWTAKVFNDKLSHHEVKQLKNKISNIPSTNSDRVNDPKQEKVLIRAYEDLVDEWIDTIPMAPEKQELFTNNKNEIVHALAVKIFKIQTKSKYLPAETLEKKLQEELSYWLKKLPLHGKVDNQFDRDKLATNLVKSIHIHNILNSLENQPMPRIDEIVVNQVKNVILEGIQRKPIEQEKSVEKEKHEETATKELAHKPNGTLGDKNAIIIDEDIIARIKKLDPKLDDEHVKNLACELTLYLQNLDQFEQRKQLERENNFLVDTIEVWLKGLPLHVADVNQFKKQITDFVKSIKQLISSGSDIAAMKKKILIFTRSLPIRHLKKYDLRFLNEQVSKLMQSLNIFPDDDEPNELQTKTNEIVHDTVKDWIATLPLKAIHCPAELRALTNEISSVITFALLNPEHNLTHQNEMILLEEIVNFLRRFPLIHEMSTESHISRMARELLNSLKNLNINLFRNENFAPLNNVTVYDVSLQKTNATDDSSIQSVKENDINNNAAAYTEQLVKQISEWLNCLNLPIGNKQGFKEVVINDLAGDIVDRRKYLELNPNNIGTEEDELEHLKYQIFKWINKLVGEENLKTIEHAEELMRRINQIPVPMLVRPQDKDQAAQSSLNQCCQEYIESQRNKSQNINSPRRMSGVRQVAVRFRGSPPAPEATSNHMSSPDDIQNPDVPCCSQDPPPKPPPPEEGTKKALFEKYMKIFSDACASLAIDDPSPLRDLAKTAIYNGILKTFFNLKSNPDIENDYEYFEFILEERLDNFLDVLPQTEEFIRRRHAWKANILEHAINFLEELHKFEDAPSFRQLLRNKFNRKFAIKHELEHCFQLQQGFLSKMADAYILETNYKEKDPVKANIYRNRLMKRVDELANHLSKEHNVGFRFFNPPQLHRLAMKVLEEVPIPTDTILQDEVEEIQLTDEVEKWYKELPTQPARTENEVVLRKRFFELLAKKLHDIHKRVPDEDPSKEAKMKHEVSQFLEKRADLQPDEDLNINFMVDQLHNRIKNRWLQVPGEYDEFAKFKPFSSSFAHVDDAEFLAPLIEASPRQAQDAGQRTLVDPEYFIQPGQPMQSIGPGLVSHGPGAYGGTANRTRISQGRPSQGYASQQGMRASAPPRSQQESRLTPKSPRQNLSLPAGRSGQVSMVRQSPQPPTNGRAALHSSLPNQRAQNINRSLRQVDQVRGSSRSDAQGQLFVPGRTRQSRSLSPGATGSRGPTPSQGIGTTAEAETGGRYAPDSSDEEMLDAEHYVKCKCLDVMRRRMRNYYDFPCIHRYR